jgi:hypothetical protein
MKLKIFCTTKEMATKLKRPPTEWEKAFAIYTSDKGLIIRKYRALKKLNSPKINDPVKKWANELNRSFYKGRSPNGKKKKSHKERLNIPGHKGNANQNHVKILPCSC